MVRSETKGHKGMNSWEIIKAEMAKSRPGTMGRNIEVNRCGRLFVALERNLTDREAATESMNNDDECRQAVAAGPAIRELREAGVIG